jgi:hypothetical protein
MLIVLYIRNGSYMRIATSVISETSDQQSCDLISLKYLKYLKD